MWGFYNILWGTTPNLHNFNNGFRRFILFNDIFVWALCLNIKFWILRWSPVAQDICVNYLPFSATAATPTGLSLLKMRSQKKLTKSLRFQTFNIFFVIVIILAGEFGPVVLTAQNEPRCYN